MKLQFTFEGKPFVAHITHKAKITMTIGMALHRRRCLKKFVTSSAHHCGYPHGIDLVLVVICQCSYSFVHGTCMYDITYVAAVRIELCLVNLYPVLMGVWYHLDQSHQKFYQNHHHLIQVQRFNLNHWNWHYHHLLDYLNSQDYQNIDTSC